jgi:hypothetical protein
MKMLLADLTPTEAPPRDFPKSPRKLASRVKRLAPALEAVGVFVCAPGKTDKTRTWGILTAQTARSPQTHADGVENAVDPWAIPI